MDTFQTPTAATMRDVRHTRRRAAFLLAAFVCLALPRLAVAQAPTPSAPTPTAAELADDFGRAVPRTSVRGFLEACWAPNDERAANYLDLRRLSPATRADEGPRLASQLCTVLDRTIWVDPEQLSDAAEGERDDGLPARRDIVGTVQGAKGPVQILIERVPRDDGVLIWKIASETVAKIPALYQEFGYGRLGELLPKPLIEVRFLQVQLWQWFAVLALMIVATLVGWLLTQLALPIGRALVARTRTTVDDKLLVTAAGPLRLTLAILLFYAGTSALALSMRAQAFVDGSAKILTIVGITWLLIRFVDVLSKVLERYLLTRRHVARSFVPLGRRSAKIFVGVLGFIVMLQNLGFNATSLLAGLGIGGLAVALAAQKTVENLFGSVTLVTDQPVRVGDYCRFGDKVGKIQDIGLRSTRVRTLDRTIVSIPNAEFAAMHLENLSRRDRFWLQTTLGLHYDTTPQQLRSVLTELRKAVLSHSHVDPDRTRIRFVGFGSTAFRLEIYAYILTSDISEFTSIREDILLQTADIVSAAGARFAAA